MNLLFYIMRKICWRAGLLKENYPTIMQPLTNPGKSASLKEENVLAATPDDYGMSYYFRGAVDKNFVIFSGMCWRIVRITGDGSVKLVLYNKKFDNCKYSEYGLDTIDAVNRKISEVLNLTKSQFNQTAMIAQGDFMKILNAKSDERKKLFN